MFKVASNIIFPIAILWASYSSASVISSDSYSTNDNNQMYWTNNTLDLDVMRLSYSDLLNTDGSSFGEQASYEDINTYLSSQNEWRWATVDEFSAVQNWFDTDPNSRDWTEAQNEGSSLFFALNGTGPRYEYQADDVSEYNYGYSSDGWVSWDIVTDFGFNYEFPEWSRRDDTTLRYVAIGDYADTHPLAYINPENTDIHKGWHNLPDDPGQYYTSYQTLSSGSANAAALIVRNSTTSVPEPSTTYIFSLFFLLYFRKNLYNFLR